MCGHILSSFIFLLWQSKIFLSGTYKRVFVVLFFVVVLLLLFSRVCACLVCVCVLVCFAIPKKCRIVIFQLFFVGV